MDGPKSKKTRTKPPRSRPASTAAHAQPAPDLFASSPQSASFAAFSGTGDLFAVVSPAVDKHRLRVYDVRTGRCTAEHALDTVRATALRWARLRDAVAAEEPSRKRRKRRASLTRISDADTENPDTSTSEVVLLGLASGALLVFSPAHGRVLSTLSHPASITSILAIAVPPGKAQDHVWTSSADGVLRLWDTGKGIVVGTWRSNDRTPYSCIALRPAAGNADEDEDEDEDTKMFAANHAIRLLALSRDALSTTIDCDTLASVTGHASPVIALEPEPVASSSASARFFSIAESDRFVNVWEMPASTDGEPATEGKLAASIALDADARHIHVSLPLPGDPSGAVLLALSATGTVTIYPVPTELTDPALSKGGKQKVPTLVPRSTIALAHKKGQSTPVQVVCAALVPGKRQARVAKLVGGVRPVFEDVVRPDSRLIVL
jgi:U3 small nucleolar RNA-associated protein 5